MYQNRTNLFIFLAIEFIITFLLASYFTHKWGGYCFGPFAFECTYPLWITFIIIAIFQLRLYFKPISLEKLIKQLSLFLLVVLLFLAVTNPNMDKFKDYTFSSDDNGDASLRPIRNQKFNYTIYSFYEIKTLRPGFTRKRQYIGIANNFYEVKTN